MTLLFTRSIVLARPQAMPDLHKIRYHSDQKSLPAPRHSAPVTGISFAIMQWSGRNRDFGEWNA
jgi:hypothetical protein